MCNAQCIIFGATILKKDEVEGKRVIEVGSSDVNGSLRPILESWNPAEYVGIDIEPGPGVDLICPADQLLEKFGQDSFDVVLSTCVLEHIKDWRGAISNMKKVCKPNGILLVIVPSDWPFHAFPHDYWRFAKEDIENIFSDSEILVLTKDKEKPSLVYTKVRKPENFSERDLSGYQLYSIILNKKKEDITEDEYNEFLRRMVLMDKIRTNALRLVEKVLAITDRILTRSDCYRRI